MMRNVDRHTVANAMIPKPWMLFAVAVGVTLLWFGNLWLVTTLFPLWETRGQFGDVFGSVNALFSGLAFAGLIYTILLQRHELSQQREELKLQREEMARSREQLAEQARAQQAHVQATIVQLRIIALQTKVRAIEIDSYQKVEHARGEYAQQIRNLVQEMEQLVDSLSPKKV